jgi:uncharacterized protein (TIGR00369 family)
MTTPDRVSILKQVIPELKHCKALGMEVVDASKGTLTLRLPYSEQIIGNPETRVIHGGVLTTLMDTACGFAAISAIENAAIAPTLDLRIDYMRPAEPDKAVLGHAEVYRITRNVLFARGIAYQDSIDKPVAHCTATFMCLDANSLDRGTQAARERLIKETIK